MKEEKCADASENTKINKYIDELKEEIFNLGKENMFLKECIKRLFDI
jgi:hypothetical protein